LSQLCLVLLDIPLQLALLDLKPRIIDSSDRLPLFDSLILFDLNKFDGSLCCGLNDSQFSSRANRSSRFDSDVVLDD